MIFQKLDGMYSVVSGRMWLKFKLIQAFMHFLVCCKNEEDPIENDGARVLTTFLPLCQSQKSNYLYSLEVI